MDRIVNGVKNMVDNTKHALYTMSLHEWIIVIVLVIAVVSVLVYLFSDKNSFGMTEEGFLDEHFTDTTSENAFKGPIDLTNLQSLENEQSSPPSFKLLLVFDDNCPHCRDFKPTWNSLSEKYNQKKVGNRQVVMYQVGNSNASLRYQVEKKYNVQGYPTILIFKDGGVTEYQNLRDFASFSSFIETQCAN
jgi:thiol-disulfide isomerase/thioredoxin